MSLNKSTIYMIVGISLFVVFIIITAVVIINHKKSSESIPAQSTSAPMVEKTTTDSNVPGDLPNADPMTTIAAEETHKIKAGAFQSKYAIDLDAQSFSDGVAWCIFDDNGSGIINTNGELVYKLDDSRFNDDDDIKVTPFINGLSAVYQCEETARGCSTPGFVIVDNTGNEVYECIDDTMYMCGQANDGTFIIAKHKSDFSDNKWCFYTLDSTLELLNTGIEVDHSSEYDENRTDIISQNSSWKRIDSGIYVFDYSDDYILNLNNNSWYMPTNEYDYADSHIYFDDHNMSEENVIFYDTFYRPHGRYELYMIDTTLLNNVSSSDEFKNLLNEGTRFDNFEDRDDCTFKLWHGGSFYRGGGGVNGLTGIFPKDYIDGNGNTLFTFPEFSDGIEYKCVTNFSDGFAALCLIGKDGESYVTIINESGEVQYEPVKVSGFSMYTFSEELRDSICCKYGYVFVYDSSSNTLYIVSPDGEYKKMGDNFSDLSDGRFIHESESLSNFYISLSEGYFYFADIPNKGAMYISVDGSNAFDSVTAKYNSRGDLLYTDQTGNLTCSGSMKNEGTDMPPNEPTSSEVHFNEDVYKQFIEDEKYLTMGDVYYNDSEDLGYYYGPISFALYDMDADEIPELFVTNGGASYADSVIYVYGYSEPISDEISFLGSITGGSIRHGTQSDFPGVFTSDAHTGSSWTDYYYRQGNGIIKENVVSYEEIIDETGWTGEREETSRTSINGLFEANENSSISIVFTSKYDYNAIGWDGFVEKCSYSSLM